MTTRCCPNSAGPDSSLLRKIWHLLLARRRFLTAALLPNASAGRDPARGFCDGTLIGESRRGPSKAPCARLVLVLDPLESPVDLVDVPEVLGSQFGDLTVNLGERL